jgi:hypothetical protein
MIRRAILAAACLPALAAWAQVTVRLDLERDRYLLYEPMIATVDLQNYGAGQVQLTDQDSTTWLRFEIARSTGERIGVAGAGFLAGTVTLAPGQVHAKAADLVAYYHIREPGQYRIRAMVKAANLGATFASRERVVEVVAGRHVLNKPGGFKDEAGKEGLRNYTVLEVRLGREVWLYARVEDPRTETIYGVLPLGEWVTFSTPAGETDKDGNFHVLQQAQPRHFRYTVITPQAKVLKRESLSNYNSVPELKRQPDGMVKVAGGESMSRPQVRPAAPPAP